MLEWQIALIDESNKEGSMEFSVAGNRADDFFPVDVSFNTNKTYANIKVRAAPYSFNFCSVDISDRLGNQRGRSQCFVLN